MISVPKENFIPVHGKADIFIGSLSAANREEVAEDIIADDILAEDITSEETASGDEEGTFSDDAMGVHATTIVIYVDGRAYEIDLDDPENKEALSPNGNNLTWLKGKLVDPAGLQDGMTFALGVDPTKLSQAIASGVPVPEHLKDIADPAHAAAQENAQMVVVEKKLEAQKQRNTGPAFIDIVSGETGVKEDQVTGEKRMHYRTDDLKTGFDGGAPVEEQAPGRGKGWKSFSLQEAGAGLEGIGGTSGQPITATLTGSALAAVADIKSSIGAGFSAQSVTLNDVGSNVVNSGEVAATIEKQRNQDFSKGQNLPGTT